MNDIVKALDGRAFAESQVVGKRFGKGHRETLRKIDEIIKDLTVQNCTVTNYFIESEYTNERNRTYRNFLMNRDGFSLLAMSFTGPKAMKFKVQFIDAFNKMEKALKKQSMLKAVAIETRKTLTDRVQESGENERMHGHGFSTYTRLAYKIIGIKYKKPKKGERFRDSLDQDTVERLENVESMMQSLLKAGKQYEDVKQTITGIFGEPKQLSMGE